MYKYVLFDLDGTLTDPALGITNSIIYALKKWGITPPAREQLYKFIGPPLAKEMQKEFALTAEESMTMLSYYREYFSDRGLFENEIYSGIPQLLADLKAGGRRLALATSKPQVFAEDILKHFGIFEYFDVISGASLDGTHDKKADVIRMALSRFAPQAKESAVMVGDRCFDAEGAAEVGIPCIAVGYGYGSDDELKTAGASFYARTVDELAEILLKSEV